MLHWIEEKVGAGTITSTARKTGENGFYTRRTCYGVGGFIALPRLLLSDYEPYMHIKRDKAKAVLALGKLIRRTHLRGAHRLHTEDELKEREALSNLVSPQGR